MTVFFDSLLALEKVYFISALAGGLTFVIIMSLQFFGADMDFDSDTDVDVGDTSGTADLSFKLLSVNGLSAFFMIFGLTGLALMRDLHMEWFESIFGATAAGAAMVWVLKKLFAVFAGLKSSGTIKIENAVSEEGTVYLNIPSEGVGKVQVPIQGRLRTMEAVSADGIELKTGDRVKVVQVVSGNTLKVRKS